MKKIILFVLSVFIVFNWLLSYTFAQWFGVQRWTSIWVSGGSDDYYEEESLSTDLQSSINYILALYWLYVSWNFITSPSSESFKKVFYVWVLSFIVNLWFSFMETSRYRY
jgi:UDP-N-acetylmuramyl pentapeptide phosphotransferase/UDP-N-acetylglucosamine-1-phosphate transferase